jgi:hypothetical protein
LGVARLLDFPNPVNEKAARTVAAGVVVLCAMILVTGWAWLTVVLAVGFLARLASGPRFSILGRFATQVAAPRLGTPKLVPGPPKRFAQGIGATLAITAAILHLGFGDTTAALVLVAMVLVAATLEAVFAFCLGCTAFAGLMRLGVIPPEVCEACNNLSLRRPTAA